MATLENAPALAARSPWLRTLVANIQDAVIVLDSGGRVIFESPSVTRLLGEPEERRATSLGLHRVHPDERETVISSFERTIAVPASVARATYRFQRADGAWQHLEAVAKNLLHDPELQGVLITLRDVTERIQALEAAERAGRARDEFLSRMSHELRTPLHAILGWAQLLETSGDEGVREAVEQISSAGHHLLRLVEEALDLAAIREGRITLDIQPIEVGSLVRESVELIRPLADRRDIGIRTEARASRTLKVMADPVRLRQVLLNLLSNAVKYNRCAGEVVVGWGSDGVGGVRIAVRDDGPGLSEERLRQVFERFERLGMETTGIEGTGLGLAISRHLVQMMNGTLGVESRPGAGAEFWLRLPTLRRWAVNEQGGTVDNP
jgi:PAS domain S-box-containing protein